MGLLPFEDEYHYIHFYFELIKRLCMLCGYLHGVDVIRYGIRYWNIVGRMEWLDGIFRNVVVQFSSFLHGAIGEVNVDGAQFIVDTYHGLEV